MLEKNEKSTDPSKKIEDLPLQERIKYAETYNPFQDIVPGTLIDALDTVPNWCVAEVLSVQGNDIKVNYDGWTHKFDAVNRGIISIGFKNWKQQSRPF